jgi:hypothetical protein
MIGIEKFQFASLRNQLGKETALPALPLKSMNKNVRFCFIRRGVNLVSLTEKR